MRLWPFVVGLMVAPSMAWGQPTDYSAGKTPPQLFASDCSACHQTPRGLAKGKSAGSLAGFLRGHYTTKVESAEALAAFLASAPAGPSEARGRQHGAGRGPAAEARPPRPAVGVDGEDETVITPAGEGLSKRRAAAAKDGAKPGAKGRGKPDAAEAAREAAEKAAEAAKAAEEAMKSKVRAYATVGEEARPKLAPPDTLPAQATTPPPEPSQTGTTAAPAAADAEAASPSAQTARPDPPADASPPDGPASSEHPATSPPG